MKVPAASSSTASAGPPGPIPLSPEGTTVTVLSMQGVTLTVEPKVVNKPVNG